MTLSNATIRLDGGPDAPPHRPASPGTSWNDREAAAAYGPGAVARQGDRELVFLARLGGDGAGQPGGAAPARPRDVGTRVNDLVTLLGDDSFQEREKASRDLLALRTSGLPRLQELMDQAGRPKGHAANNPDLETVCDKIRSDLEIRKRLERLFEKLESGGPGGAFQDIARAAGNRDLPFAERSAAQSVIRGMSADDLLNHASYASGREVDAKPGFVPLTDQQVKDLRQQLTQLSDRQLMDYVNAAGGGKGWNKFAGGAAAIGAAAAGGAIGAIFGNGQFDRQEVSETDLRRGLVASMMLEGRPGGTTVETTASISAQLGQHVLRDAQTYDYDSPSSSRIYCARAERYLKYAADHLPAQQAIQTNIALADLYRRPTDQHANGRPAECIQALERARAEINRQAAAAGFMPHEAIELERMAGNLQQSNLRLTKEQRTQLDKIATEARENVQKLKKQEEEMNQNMNNKIRNLPNLMPGPAGGAGPGAANPAGPGRGGGNAAPQPGQMMPRPQPVGP